MKKPFLELFGWYGTVAVFGAYALVSFSLMEAKSTTYLVLNGTGALGIGLVSINKRSYQPAALNLAWLLVALMGIVKTLG